MSTKPSLTRRIVNKKLFRAQQKRDYKELKREWIECRGQVKIYVGNRQWKIEENVLLGYALMLTRANGNQFVVCAHCRHKSKQIVTSYSAKCTNCLVVTHMNCLLKVPTGNPKYPWEKKLSCAECALGVL